MLPQYATPRIRGKQRTPVRLELGSRSIVTILVVCDRGGCFGTGMTLAGFCGGASWSVADAGTTQTPSKSNVGSMQLVPRLNLMIMRSISHAWSASIHG